MNGSDDTALKTDESIIHAQQLTTTVMPYTSAASADQL